MEFAEQPREPEEATSGVAVRDAERSFQERWLRI